MNALVLALGKRVDQQEELLKEYQQHLWPQLIRCEISRYPDPQWVKSFAVVNAPHMPGEFTLLTTSDKARSPGSWLHLKYFREHDGQLCWTPITKIEIKSSSAQSSDYDVRLHTAVYNYSEYYITVRAGYVEMGFVGHTPICSLPFPKDYDPRIKETLTRYLEEIGYISA